MPDLTLYEDDVELIRDALDEFRISTKRRFDLYEEVPQNLARLYEESERLSDVLLDRLVQRLHPQRKVESELDLEFGVVVPDSP